MAESLIFQKIRLPAQGSSSTQIGKLAPAPPVLKSHGSGSICTIDKFLKSFFIYVILLFSKKYIFSIRSRDLELECRLKNSSGSGSAIAGQKAGL